MVVRLDPVATRSRGALVLGENVVERCGSAKLEHGPDAVLGCPTREVRQRRVRLDGLRVDRISLLPPLGDQLRRSSDLQRGEDDPELYVAALFASQARAGEVSGADQPPLTIDDGDLA